MLLNPCIVDWVNLQYSCINRTQTIHPVFPVADHYGVQDTVELRKLYNNHMAAFTELINRTHESSEYAEKTLAHLPYLKVLAEQHIKALSAFKKLSKTSVEFPALHRELFATEYALWEDNFNSGPPQRTHWMVVGFVMRVFFQCMRVGI